MSDNSESPSHSAVWSMLKSSAVVAGVISWLPSVIFKHPLFYFCSGVTSYICYEGYQFSNNCFRISDSLIVKGKCMLSPTVCREHMTKNTIIFPGVFDLIMPQNNNNHRKFIMDYC